MKQLIALCLALAPAVSLAYEDPQAVLYTTQQALEKASALEAAAGKKDNAVVFARMLKRSHQISLYWGHDILNRCVRAEGVGVTYAYTALDPVTKGRRYINICPFAVEQATGYQLVYVFLHELAHQWGVKHDAEANFVADRVFSLMGWGNPFLFRETRDFLSYYAGIDASAKKRVDDILAQDPALEQYPAQLKAEATYWSEALQAYDMSPYRELGKRTSATSVHRFFRLGDFALSKTRHLSQ